MSGFMDIEWTSADVDNERKLTGDRRWSVQVHQSPDRLHTETLLDISEESSALEEGPYDMHRDFGWVGAITGWDRCSPLAGLIHMQRKGKKCKSGERDYHCLLCIDMKLSQLPECHHNSFITYPTSCEDRQSKGCVSSSPLMKRPLSQPPAIFSRGNERNTCKVHLFEYSAFELGSRISKEDQQLDETSPQMDNEAFQNHGSKKSSNMILTISNFSVLPPVRVVETANMTCPTDFKKSHGTAMQAPQGSLAEDTSQGATIARKTIDLDEGEPIADSHKSVICKYWSAQSGHHLLASLNIPVSLRCGMQLSTCGGMLPLAAYPFGRQPKQDNLSSKGSQSHKIYNGMKSKTTKQSGPQLPLLLGTRVTIPASSYRLL